MRRDGRCRRCEPGQGRESATLARNWVMIPHVTHHDEADITQLDACRKQLSEQSAQKVTPLAFMMKAAVQALKAFPCFNASLGPDGTSLILKCPAFCRTKSGGVRAIPSRARALTWRA
ncbi:MAG: 2-oxo acid dehydrogenase subunit E2 [Panacagrimonas sp.]